MVWAIWGRWTQFDDHIFSGGLPNVLQMTTDFTCLGCNTSHDPPMFFWHLLLLPNDHFRALLIHFDLFFFWHPAVSLGYHFPAFKLQNVNENNQPAVWKPHRGYFCLLWQVQPFKTRKVCVNQNNLPNKWGSESENINSWKFLDS